MDVSTEKSLQCSSINVKTSSSSDKTEAAAASMLTSLAAARLTDTSSSSSSSVVFKARLQQSLPAFLPVTMKRTLHAKAD